VLANLLVERRQVLPRGGQVKISVAAHGGRVAISVTDHGRGIPADFHHRVFERFAQADASSTRQKGGTGLGLSIAKAIVERHGGHIGFETRPEVGTTFTFDLPEWGGETPIVEEPAGGPRVLVCEDDPDIALDLRLTLEREGFQVDVVGNAADAKRRLADSLYDRDDPGPPAPRPGRPLPRPRAAPGRADERDAGGGGSPPGPGRARRVELAKP